MTPRFLGLYNIVWQFLFCSFDALLSVFHKLFLQMSCKYMNFCFIDIVITLGLGKISENSSQYIHVIKEAVNFQCPFLHFWIVFYRQAILRYLAMKYTNYAGYGLSLQQQMLSESVISWCFSEVHRYISILKKIFFECLNVFKRRSNWFSVEGCDWPARFITKHELKELISPLSASSYMSKPSFFQYVEWIWYFLQKYRTQLVTSDILELMSREIWALFESTRDLLPVCKY